MLATCTTEDLYIARRLFQLEIYKRNGQDFENLFTHIMRLCNKDFVSVKPQGQFGDRKNDGFIKSEGKYFQVYAPENSQIKEKETIDKLVTNFAGLFLYWNSQVAEIREFNFVLNDKYHGAFASLYTELTKIETSHLGVKCNPFLAQHLEAIFLTLSYADMIDVLGRIPSAEEISLNVSVLNDVIEHLINLKANYKPECIPINPDFEEKITFNSLSTGVATFLRYGSYQDGELKEYFKLNSTFTKEDLKNIFASLYQEGMRVIPDSEGKNDLVFFHIANNAYPVKQKVYQDAIFVLMSYFFGYCDIFEEPPSKRNKTLFDDITI